MMKLERTINSSPNVGLLEAEIETAAPVRQGRDDLFAHQLFEDWARRMPDRAAVQARNRRLSYGELNDRANQLAHYLRSKGAGTETLVGISLERSIEMAVAILGVLKAGAAYLPLDPTYPRERLSFMRADARLRFLIVRDGLGSDIEDSDLNVIKIDRDWGLIERESKTEPEIIVAPDNLAYVIYTSGSTGNPKGVMITHGNLGHYVQSLPGSVQVSDSDVYLHTASISFSSSVRQLMFPLSLGAEVIIATVDDIADPLALFKLIKERGVTAIDIVPSYWRACNHALGELAGAERESLLDNRLRLLLSASEPLYSETVRDWRKFGHPARLVNMFGQTETAGIVFAHSIRDVEEGLIVPVGRPIANTQVYVLNSRLQQVAAGETGELHVGGAGVGHGYLNHAELTAEKFIQDPFSSNPSARLYKTGDLGRIGADGAIEFLGRIDDQVKIRGHRVEPGEIETVLRKHPSVRDAIVVPGNRNGQSLIAYVVAEDINASTISGLEKYQLPNGMGIVQFNEHETDFFYQQIFADQTNFRHGITLGKGDCVFDVGANIGLFTLFAQQVCPSVKVFAFEPIPEIFKALEVNASLHGNGAKLFNCGLAEREQSVEFVFYPNSTSQSGRYADEADEREVLRTIIDNVKADDSKNAGKVRQNELLDEIVEQRVLGERVVCNLKTLSQVIRDQGVERIDLLKIDVEKSELDVLRGIEEGDWPRIKQIVIEAHDINGQVAELTQLLRDHGFNVIAEQDRYLRGSSLYNVYASRNSLRATDRSGNTDGEPPFPIPMLKQNLLTTSELREYIQARLPDYFWPSAFVIVETLPRLPNGKVDRQSLPEPQREHDEDNVEFVQVRTPHEETLARIWAEVLKLDRVSVNDNFFDLGGDSLLSAQIIAKAGRAGLRFGPKQLFQHQTIADLIKIISPTTSASAAATDALAIFDQLNRTVADYPRDSCIHQLFEQQVAATPSACAVRCGERSLTFSELDERANRLANRLQAIGVRPGSLVGIYLERSLDLVVALLGVLKAGAAYVPLDPTYPSVLLSFMLADCRADILLTQEHLAQSVDTKAKVICLDDPDLNLDREKAESISSGVTAENLAYVIYTSGSTGEPKGVMVPHRALVNYVWWAVREYDVMHGNGAPLHSSVAFDLTITSLFCPLLAGRTVTLPLERGGIEALSEALDGKDLSLIKVTPTHLRALNNLLPEDSLSGRTRVLVIGGEALHAETIATWRRNAPQTRIVNEYGPTEATVGCCAYEVKADDPENGDVLIGRPIANTQIYILDEKRQPVAVGEIGELYIGGDGLALGYIHRPELTQEYFVEISFRDHAEALLYKSGDLARLRADGNIEFLGRADQQVKIRGHRIELGEIESALRDHEAVRDAVVVVREDDIKNKRLIAYVAPKERREKQQLTNELRAFLKLRLPPFMLPALFAFREAMPVTANGKIDRSALQSSNENTQGCGQACGARSATEQTLTEIWASVLNLRQVGVHDNFFDLGGDSILAAQILALAKREGLALTPKQLFMHQTIAELSTMLAAKNESSTNSAAAKEL